MECVAPGKVVLVEIHVGFVALRNQPRCVAGLKLVDGEEAVLSEGMDAP